MEYKITESTNFNKPSLERPHPTAKEGSGTGTQKIWRFKNGFGASVVRFNIFGMTGMFGGSYGVEEGSWELAVIKFDRERFTITYKSGLTNDVVGHLSEEDVEKFLKKIKSLKNKIPKK